AKSEEGQSESAGDAKGDLARGLPDGTGMAMSRRDRIKPAADGFTPLRHSDQPSAWVTGLEWGGGIGLMALALALGFTGVRRTPRRRPEDRPRPAPAFLRNRR